MYYNIIVQVYVYYGIAEHLGVPSHGNHPARLWHLVVHFSESRSHFVSESASHYHAV